MSPELPPPSEPPDADLVRRAQRGDRETLNLLFARHWPALVASANRQWARDWDEARDLCQEACLKSVVHLPRLQNSKRFRSWVMGFIVHRHFFERFLECLGRPLRLASWSVNPRGDSDPWLPRRVTVRSLSEARVALRIPLTTKRP